MSALWRMEPLGRRLARSSGVAPIGSEELPGLPAASGQQPMAAGCWWIDGALVKPIVRLIAIWSLADSAWLMIDPSSWARFWGRFVGRIERDRSVGRLLGVVEMLLGLVLLRISGSLGSGRRTRP